MAFDTSDYEIDDRFVSEEEALEYIRGLSGRDRLNHRRTQSWFDHCARIRSHPSSMVQMLQPPETAS